MPDPLPDLDLDAIEARCKAATPGPWDGFKIAALSLPESLNRFIACRMRAEGFTLMEIAKRLGVTRERARQKFERWDKNTSQPENDHNFIAHAREDLPRAVARVRQLEAEVARLRQGAG